MSPLSDLLAVADEFPRPAANCIGLVQTATGMVEYPLGNNDATRDRAWLARYLRLIGVKPREFIVVVSAGHEAPWFGPVVDAVLDVGAVVCPLDTSSFEARRAEMLFRRFSISYVLGLDNTLISAMASVTDVAAALSGVRMVLARAEARPRLGELGIAAGVLDLLGPALAVSCPENNRVHVNLAEFDVQRGSDSYLVCGREYRLCSESGSYAVVSDLTVTADPCTCDVA